MEAVNKYFLYQFQCKNERLLMHYNTICFQDLIFTSERNLSSLSSRNIGFMFSAQN